MSAVERSEPIRSCVGCRTRRGQSALVRITRTVDGIVVGAASSGRGAWVCRSERSGELVVPECLDSALARRMFARAWRGEVSADDEREIRSQITRSIEEREGPDAH